MHELWRLKGDWLCYHIYFYRPYLLTCHRCQQFSVIVINCETFTNSSSPPILSIVKELLIIEKHAASLKEGANQSGSTKEHSTQGRHSFRVLCIALDGNSEDWMLLIQFTNEEISHFKLIKIFFLNFTTQNEYPSFLTKFDQQSPCIAIT